MEMVLSCAFASCMSIWNVLNMCVSRWTLNATECYSGVCTLITVCPWARRATFIVIDDAPNSLNATATYALTCPFVCWLDNNLEWTEKNQLVVERVSLFYVSRRNRKCMHKQARMYYPACFSRHERDSVWCRVMLVFAFFAFKLSRLICSQSSSSSFSWFSQLPYGLCSAWLTIASVSEVAHE